MPSGTEPSADADNAPEVPDALAERAVAPTPVRVAAGVTLAEALALAAAGLILVIKTATEGADSVGRALLGAALAAAGVAVLYFSARGVLAGRPAAKSPLVVLEILVLPVGYSLGIQAGLWYYGVPMLIAALVVLGALFTPAARAWLDRPDP